ncbi:interleukin-21 receptor-like isoform X2 [Acanthochromis polyacanthus]|uniref:interleukin-21 receptor-like isoform X2 n=1 Tax=Acanthochromis polyacanthus TaxID=80966 RepID=UPI0022349AF2|nr:interleukin-21 receptor-like isoform X2 [Acanthochromis polyacanthus]
MTESLKSDTPIQEGMRGRRLLFVLCCSSILAVTSCITADGLLCVNDYWDTVTCVLNISGNPVRESNSTYSLNFIDILEPGTISCPLTLVNHSYRCDCKLKHSQEYFSDTDIYRVEVCAQSDCHFVKKFDSSENIQLTPPPELLVQRASKTLNVTFKSRYDSTERPIGNFLKYELLLQTSQRNTVTNNTLPLSSPARSMLINEESQLTANAQHCIKGRYMVNHKDYNGVWSKWSQVTCWGTKAEEQDNIFVILAKCLGPVCAFVGVLLFVLYSPTARMKIKTLSHTPSPAPFFQPLFQQHHGNLQEWLSPHGQVVLTYKTEEILTTDVVAVVPKSIPKDPEENQELHNHSVTQLALTQCQTSYVSLPGMSKAPPPITMICPKDTSYTQLPCSLWGLGIAKVEVSSPPVEDFLEILSADSGCNCEDLTQSPECSLPSSPIDDNLPPCYSTDYCILNKTAEGVVPVLVSKENSVKVSPDSLEKSDS